MHTILVLVAGFVLLASCVLVGRLSSGAAGAARACLVFLPLWFVGAAVNMTVGVVNAGYGVADEAPIFLVVFAIPATVAYALHRRLR